MTATLKFKPFLASACLATSIAFSLAAVTSMSAFAGVSVSVGGELSDPPQYPNQPKGIWVREPDGRWVYHNMQRLPRDHCATNYCRSTSGVRYPGPNDARVDQYINKWRDRFSGRGSVLLE